MNNTYAYQKEFVDRAIDLLDSKGKYDISETNRSEYLSETKIRTNKTNRLRSMRSQPHKKPEELYR